jgi:fatty acid synthase
MKDQYVTMKAIFLTGIHDLKTVSPNSTLSELGMDSLTCMKIQQTLEQEFGVFLTPKQIRSLTFTRLSDMAANKQEEQPSQGTQLLLLNGS